MVVKVSYQIENLLHFVEVENEDNVGSPFLPVTPAPALPPSQEWFTSAEVAKLFSLMKVRD